MKLFGCHFWCIFSLPFFLLPLDFPAIAKSSQQTQGISYGTGGVGTDTQAPAQPELPIVRLTPNGFNIVTRNKTIAIPSGNEMIDRFFTLWWDLHNPANGYFSKNDIPFHSAETLIVEAPDYGHLTTSEGLSYWIWLEAMFARYTGDYGLLNYAMDRVEKFAIPPFQPTSGAYQPESPATYARENSVPEEYPSPLEQSVKAGLDPIAAELKSTYGPQIYGMHWLLDTRNWYGFGVGDSPTLINTFQRGRQESVWETVPHPSIEELRFGASGQGFLSLFTRDSGGYKRQWRYTNAPDADARLIQAIYWAKVYAQEQGHSVNLSSLYAKAAKMGDFLRYSFFDKYFKKIGCQSTSCAPGQGYDSAHFLLSWYYAWGGSHPEDGGAWSWRIGSSHAHFGYQNPMAAYILAQDNDFQPRTVRGSTDWNISLKRQIEFYRWLQSAEGAIAGGATNSINGRYDKAPQGQSQFYGMTFENDPVYADPPSNSWFGWQAWSMQRIAEYYFQTGDRSVESLLTRWADWAMSHTQLNTDGSFSIPVTLKWSGQPFPWNPLAPQINAELSVEVTDYNQDVGIAAALAKALLYYAKASEKHLGQKQEKAIEIVKALLDRIWLQGKDGKGLAFSEIRKDYLRFQDEVFIPKNYFGRMPNGADIFQGSTFLSLRPQYERDQDFPRIKDYLAGGNAPSFRYHRFWAQVEAALAFAEYDRLSIGQ